jgi:hypothetical protein
MINVSKWFCGVIACASLIGCVSEELDDGAAQPDPAEASDLAAPGDESIAVRRISETDASLEGTTLEGGATAAAWCGNSFTQTCSGWQYGRTGEGAIVWAQASSCRKRNGTWGGFTSWSGYCTTDVSNANGNIICWS